MGDNNVEGGVWHGSGAAPPVHAAAVTEAPSVPVMTAVKVQQQCENGDGKAAAAAPSKPDSGTRCTARRQPPGVALPPPIN